MTPSMNRSPLLTLAALGLALGLSACVAGESSGVSVDGQNAARPGPASPDAEAPSGTLDPDASSRVGGADTSEPPLDKPPEPVGACRYANPFSKGQECKEYSGAGWTEPSATADCAAPMPGVAGTFEAGVRCGFEAELGRCAVGDADGTGYSLAFEGADAALCDLTVLGCETFAGGRFAPAGPCSGGGGPAPGPAETSVFIPPYQDCRDPLPGEAPGASAGGKVCTQVAISGCTEAGRRFDRYGSCDVVRSQRPYYPLPASPTGSGDDPRLADASWVSEQAWMRSQVEASGCVCCHSDSAKAGASGWTIDAGPLWLDTVPDKGLAMLAGLVDSTVFGAFPPSENNGFDRSITGMPTTDPERMQLFLMGELERRGVAPETAAQWPPFGGPLADQLTYEPKACGPGEGVDELGRLVWTGGGARYVYVMTEGTANPGVPPNLDLPDGTLWRLDVDPTDPPMASGLVYGQVPAPAAQRYPESGAPATLEPGSTYYLVVLWDVGLPLARCLFTAP